MGVTDFSHWACPQALSMPVPFRQGARLQAQGENSRMGQAFRHGARLQARGVPSGTGRGFMHAARLQAQGFPSGTGLACRQGALVHTRGAVSGKRHAFKNRSRSARGASSTMELVFRPWEHLQVQ